MPWEKRASQNKGTNATHALVLSAYCCEITLATNHMPWCTISTNSHCVRYYLSLELPDISQGRIVSLVQFLCALGLYMTVTRQKYFLLWLKHILVLTCVLVKLKKKKLPLPVGELQNSTSFWGTLTLGTFAGKVMSLLFNTLSGYVLAFLPRSKYLLIS